jgi:hypothetical protein
MLVWLYTDRKEIMTDEQIAEKVAEAIQERTAHCERGVLAIGENRDGTGVGFAMVAPNSILMTLALVPGFPLIDCWLN